MAGEDHGLLLYEKDSHNSENNIDLKNKTPKIISYEKITPLENEIKHFFNCDDVSSSRRKLAGAFETFLAL